MEQQFKKGDTVQLKSGGPIMTVERDFEPSAAFERDGVIIRCQWFKGAALQSRDFPVEALRVVNAAEDKS